MKQNLKSKVDIVRQFLLYVEFCKAIRLILLLLLLQEEAKVKGD